jgi:hypothetical protein
MGNPRTASRADNDDVSRSESAISNISAAGGSAYDCGGL